jgi:dihydroorotate dehydrogenase electron transfer subunit
MTGKRGTIFLEEARIIDHAAFPGDQHVLRVRAPRAARKALAGSFAHLRCDASIPMRRPLSIMRSDADAGWLEFLYKPVGAGLAKLTEHRAGDRLSVLAPIGNGFRLSEERPRVIAIGGGVGIPPMVFLAQQIRNRSPFRPLILMGSEVPFPFDLVPAGAAAGGLGIEEPLGIGLLDEWGIPSLLASNAGLAGAWPGHVTELARQVLGNASAAALAETQLVACGPEPMLRATARLAAELGLPCQLALEEFMACGVGGCAGCTVLVHGPEGDAMRRVCVDGPVFEAREIYPETTA